MRTITRFLYVLLPLAALATGCIKDPSFKPADISVDRTTVDFEPAGGTAVVTLQCNRDWSLEIVGEEVTWLAVSQLSGTASGQPVEIELSALPLDGVTRQAVLNFRTETVYASVKVTQKGNVSSAVTVFEDDFSTVTEANVLYTDKGWSFHSSDPSDVYYGWRTGVFNSDKYIQIAPYSSSQSQVTGFALMPLLNVRDASLKTLTFDLAIYYKDEDASRLEVVASTDFSGDFNAASWTTVYDATFPAGSQMNVWKTHTVDLTESCGDAAEIWVAFRYTGKSNTYRLDNVVFGKEGGDPGDPGDPGAPGEIGDNWKNEPVNAFGDDFQSIRTDYIRYVSDNWTFWSSDMSEINSQFKTRIFNTDEKYLDIAPYGSQQSRVTAFALLPAANVSGASPAEVKFDTAIYYKEEDDSKFELVVSRDFDGDFTKATWTAVYDATYPAGSEMNVWKTHTADLSAYAGDSRLFVAFRYTGKSNTYRLDNVIFGTPDNMNGGNEGEGGGGNDGEGGEGDGIYTSNLALPEADNRDDACYTATVLIDGKEYPGLKLGTSSKGGTYTVSSLPETGDVTLSFYAVAWNGKPCDLTVAVSGGGSIDGAASKTVTLVSNSGAANNSPYTIAFGDHDFYTFRLTGATASTKLTFSTQDSKPRTVMVGMNVRK